MVKMAEICQGMKTEFEKEPKECGGVYLLGRVVQSIGEATMFNGLTSAKLTELKTAQFWTLMNLASACGGGGLLDSDVLFSPAQPGCGFSLLIAMSLSLITFFVE